MISIMEQIQNRQDWKIIFFINTIVIFIIGVLLLAFAEPLHGNWLIGLGLIGTGIIFGFIIMKWIKKLKN